MVAIGILIAILLFSLGELAMGIQKERKEEGGMHLVLYEGPKSLKDATEEDMETVPENRRDISLKHCVDTTVAVDGQDCYVYDTNVNHNRKWVENYLPPLSRTPITYFDFAGRADIKVTVPNQALDQVTISPASYKIKPKVDKKNHTVTFSITNPDTYTVEFDGTPFRALHIFANPIEENIPDFSDENVVYVGPGEWDIDTISLESGQTLYISGGAVVHGIVNANFAENVTVMGRGIIDGSKMEGWQGKMAYVPLKFDHCNKVAVKDVIALNSNAWVCQCFETKNASIDGINVVSARPNGDGITLQSCENIEVKNCFVRSWDDSLVVKNYEGNSKGIHFLDMQLWTDFAQSMEIGYETNKGQQKEAAISNISFSNICVLHNFHKPVISVHNGDDAKISDIAFNHIVVEDAQMGSGDGSDMPYMIDLNIAKSDNWSTTRERGTIDDVQIDGVTVLSGKFSPSRISGYDKDHRVTNVNISNLEILGEKMKTFEDAKFEIEESTTDGLSIE